MRTALLPPGDWFVDSVTGTARGNGQPTWPFLAGACVAMGFVIAVVVAQVAQAMDIRDTKLPAIAVMVVVASGLAVSAAVHTTPAAARSGLGSASAGLMTGIAITGVPLSLLLFPAAFLAGAGAALLIEADKRSSVRQMSASVFVVGLVIGIWWVIR